MKIRIIKAILRWLLAHYPYLCRDAFLPERYHIHKNPRKVKPALVGHTHTAAILGGCPTREAMGGEGHE